MKKRIVLLSLVAFIMQLSTLPLTAQSRDEAAWVASEQGFLNAQQVINEFTIGDYVKCQFAKGSGSAVPVYYVSDAAVRVYAKNTMTFSPQDGASIQRIVLTCKKRANNTAYLMVASVTEGTLEDDPVSTSSTDIVQTVWTGDNTKGLTFTMKAAGQRCIMKIDITYTSPSGTFYTVTYTANGGVGDDVVYSYSYNTTAHAIPTPFDRDEYVFSHWNTAADNSGTSYLPGDEFTVTDNITLYAQWTTSINLSVDVINTANVNEAIGDTTGYNNWELSLPNTVQPRVTYKGKSSKNNNYIQMNSSISGTSSYSGIVTTHTNNLKAKKVKVTWHGATDAGRTLDIYGRNTPYSGTTDLYGDTQGTFLGSIVNGTASAELDIESLGTYSYIGIRSQSGAVYLSEIRIIWETLDATAPIVLIEPATVDLGNVVVDHPLSVDFTVSQANLTEALTLTATVGVLSVGGEPVSTIPAGPDPTVVTWSYTPDVPNTDMSARIEAASGSATSTLTSTLTITAKVLPAEAQTLHESKAAFVDHGITSACINLAGVEVIGQSGYYLYLQDAEAGLLVYGTGAPSFVSGDKFTSGYLMGTYENYNGIIEIKNFQFVDPAKTQGALTAVTATVDEILDNINKYDSRYVQLSDVNISNWTVAGTNGSLPFHDRFQTGYATKTAPAASDAFTVKGLFNGYYSNNTLSYQIDPVALTDISTTVKAGAPAFYPNAQQTSPSTATSVQIRPAANTVAYYRINDGDPIAVSTWTYINLTNPTTVLKAYGTRDFYANSDEVVSYYQLPANSFTVSFSINGVVNPANNVVVSGELQANQTPSVTALGDFAFAGWSLSENSTQTITLPYPISDNTTLYAVYLKGQQFVYKKVDNVSDFVDGEYVILAEGGSDKFAIKNGRTTGSPIAYSISSLGITVSSESTLEGGDLSELTWNFSGTSANMTITSTADPANYLYIISNNSSTGVRVGHTNENTSWTITEDLAVTAQFNMRCNGRYLVVYNDQDWRSYANTGNANSYHCLFLFRKQAVIDDNAPRYTRVFWNETASGDISLDGPSVVPSGYYLNMNDKTMANNNAANLLIENNADLKLTYGNTGVMATVKKDIVGYANDTVRTGWHLLSSPVGALSTDEDRAPEGLLTGDYDLYAFDQTKPKEWQNHKVQDANVSFGDQGGVLYANKATTTIIFKGALTATPSQPDLVYDADARLCGWNLIGNPYTCPGYLNIQYSGEGEATAITDYYKLQDVSENGKKFSKLMATSIDTPVSSMEGVFVQAPAAGYKYWFVNSNRGPVVPNAGFINIMVSGSDGEVMDMARVRFNQGGLLGKFSIGEGGSQLYIPVGGKNYAVVPSQHQGELPLNFKAAEDGEYTIAVDLGKAEMNYLHLIDNMTSADINLLETPDYTFEAKAGDYASRFRLVFNANVTEPEEGPTQSFAYFNGSSWVVTGLEADAILQVVDMMGRVIVSKDAKTGVSANEMSQGLYVLRLISGDTVKTQKVVVK